MPKTHRQLDAEIAAFLGRPVGQYGNEALAAGLEGGAPGRSVLIWAKQHGEWMLRLGHDRTRTHYLQGTRMDSLATLARRVKDNIFGISKGRHTIAVSRAPGKVAGFITINDGVPSVGR